MSLQDPIADMLTRIRNAQARSKRSVSMPSSKLKAALCGIMKEEGYITDFRLNDEGAKATLDIELKYFDGKPVIETLREVSKPGLRRYCNRDDLPRVMNGLGTAIISTSQGVMTDKSAREKGLGGEVICIIA